MINAKERFAPSRGCRFGLGLTEAYEVNEFILKLEEFLGFNG